MDHSVARRHHMFHDSRPFTRWWWFSGPIDTDGIDRELDWLVEQGFGGVEIAWVYPQPGTPRNAGPRFLDEQFIAAVRHAIEGCAKRGIGCDLTFGTLWPFCGSFIDDTHAARTLMGLSEQRVDRSWEARYHSYPVKVLDHLDKKALYWYSSELQDLLDLAKDSPAAMFCDSWEVDPVDLGYRGMFEDFIRRFGYDLTPFASRIAAYPEVRFDYRVLIAERILSDFFEPFSSICDSANVTSRVQCHGAPTDLLSAYSLCDIPESETLLFDPEFALIAASAAAWNDAPIVSSESFSCIYGWVPTPLEPPYLGNEHIDDLRCVAASQFAWGVNRVVWHGMPLGGKRFYASVHVGPDGALAPHFKRFNEELACFGAAMSKGSTVSNLAIYLPLEDQWMKDEVPEASKKPSYNWYWELQELEIDDQLMPYRPLWFSPRWIDELEFIAGKLLFRGKDIGSLYCDSEWMSYNSVCKLEELVKSGAPVIFNRWPKEPGYVQHDDYLNSLGVIQRAMFHTLDDVRPLVSSPVPIDFWCRMDGDTMICLFCHPQVRNLGYPLPYRFADSVEPTSLEVTVHADGIQIPLLLEFTGGTYAVVREVKIYR